MVQGNAQGSIPDAFCLSCLCNTHMAMPSKQLGVEDGSSDMRPSVDRQIRNCQDEGDIYRLGYGWDPQGRPLKTLSSSLYSQVPTW